MPIKDTVEIGREMQELGHSMREEMQSESATLLNGAPMPSRPLESSTLRKLNWRILPFTAFIVMLSYIDRGNLGFVAADVCAELGMNHTMYGIGVGFFGIGYVTSQVPSNYLLRRCGATLWFALLMVFWGTIAASFAATYTVGVFYLLRALLGVAEGGTFPGVWYYLSLFYPPRALTYPYATIAAAISISTPIAAPLAATLLQLDGLFGIEGWRLLFFFEGLIPILYGGLLYWILPAKPESSTFLKAEEKNWLAQQENHCHDPNRNLIDEIKIVAGTKSFWILTVASFVRGMLLTAFFYWMTLIIDHMLNKDETDNDTETCAASDSTDLSAVLLTSVPFSICAAVSLAYGYFSRNVKQRSGVAGKTLALSGVFLIGWILTKDQSFPVALLCLSFAMSCCVSPAALIIGLVGSLFDRETRATAVAIFNSVEGFGQIVGPFVIGVVLDNHGYGLAVTILAIAAFLGGLILFVVKDPLENDKLENKDPESGHILRDVQSSDAAL